MSLPASTMAFVFSETNLEVKGYGENLADWALVWKPQSHQNVTDLEKE